MLSVGQVTSPSWSTLSISRTGAKGWSVQQIAIGDGVYYANFKEPFEQLEGAMPGYPLGELPYDADMRLLCPYADRHDPRRRRTRSDRAGRTRIVERRLRNTYHNLGAHLAKTHSMTADEFRAEAGLNQTAALVSERTRLLNSASAQRLRAAKRFVNGPSFTSETGHAAGVRAKGSKRTPQKLNSKGWCYRQVLVTAQRVQQENGRITEALMKKAGVGYKIVVMHFGSWDAFLRRMEEGVQRSGVFRKDADLITDLRSIASDLGHTPTVSDMRRYQMASRSTYEKHFGSWTQACERAEVQPNVPAIWLTRPGTAEEDAAILGAYAITGSYFKAAERHGISWQRARSILSRYGLSPINGNAVNQIQRQEQMALAATLAQRLVA